MSPIGYGRSVTYLTVSPRPMPAGVAWTKTPSAIQAPVPQDVVCLTPIETSPLMASPWTLAQAGGWLSTLKPRPQSKPMQEKEVGRYQAQAPVDRVELSVEEDSPEPAVPADLLSALERLVPHQPGRGDLLRLWLRLGATFIERCSAAGITTWKGALNRYERSERRLRVAGGSEREALAVIAQACDHALGGEDFASRSAMAVLTACQGETPEEFFSRSLAGHVSGERGPLSAYLDYLLTRRSHTDERVAV